jgi:hypothetical protein
MAIILDGSSSGSVNYGSSITQSHTIGAGSDRLLVVGVVVTSSVDKVTGITYGGSALTRIRAESAGNRTYLYYLKNPAVGTANIVVSLATADCDGVAVAQSFRNVDQTSPFLSDNGAAGTFISSPNAISLTVDADSYSIDMIGCGPAQPNFTVGSGQTQVAKLDNGGSAFGAMSVKAAADSMSWTFSDGPRVMSHSAVALKMVVPPPDPTTGTIAITEQTETVAATVTVSGSATLTLAITESLETVSANLELVSGTVTTGPLKNNTDGQALANLTGLTATVLKLSDMSFVKTFTGVTTNGSGVVTLSDPLLLVGTTFVVVIKNAAGTLGCEKYTAV